MSHENLLHPVLDFRKEMVPVGFEPATFGSHVQRSYHLSYGTCYGTAAHRHRSLVSVRIFPLPFLHGPPTVGGAWAFGLMSFRSEGLLDRFFL